MFSAQTSDRTGTSQVTRKNALTNKLLTATVSVVLLAATGCEVATFSADARRKGLQLYNQGNYTDAAGSFQNAVKQRPTDYQSHFYMGQAFEKLGQLQRAIQAYKASRDTQLETLEGIRDTGFRQRTLDALAGAIAKSTDRDHEIDLLRQRAGASRNGEDLITIARVFRAGGDPDSAISTYQETTTRFPSEHAYYKEFGFYLQSLGLKEQAKQVLTQATKIKLDTEVDAALKGL